MPRFDVHPDIRKAHTLPSSFYLHHENFIVSMEKIFSRTWQFAGLKSEVDNLKPITLLEGSLNEPVLLVRNDDSVNAFSNVCTHRGKILVEQSTKASLIRCGYHGRRFSLNGKFLSMPEFEDVDDFPSSSDDLTQLPVGNITGFLFISLDPTITFGQQMSGVKAPFSGFDPAKLKLNSVRDYEVNCHWALYCENYLEGFHIPYVHRSLNEIVDYGTYTTETFRYSCVQTGYDKNGNAAASYLFLFPNTMFNFYPWGISVNVVLPIAPDRCVVRFLTYVSDQSKLDTGAGADLHTVELEDEAVVESVQKGIRSRFYDRGRYSPTREQGTHHFHRLIAEFME